MNSPVKKINLLVACSLIVATTVVPLNAREVSNAVDTPQPSPSIIIIGESLIGEESSAICLQELVDALKTKPNDAKLLVLKAAVENYECQYSKAIADASAAIKASPNYERAYALRAEAELRSGLFDAARKDMLKAGSLSKPKFYEQRSAEVDDLEYDFKHQEKQPARRLALACTAVLFTQNRQGCSSLAGAEPNENLKSEQKDLLVQWWDVHDRDELLDTLKHQLCVGHNTRWQRMQKEIEANRPLDSFKGGWNLPQDFEAAIQLVKKYGKQFGSRGLLAWDHCRCVALCRWGYQAGYLTEAEAWELIMPVAARIQKQSKNWQQLATDYLIGRNFWCDSIYQEGAVSSKKIQHRLLHDPNSPWVKLPLQSIPIVCKSDDATIVAIIERLRNGRKVQRSAN